MRNRPQVSSADGGTRGGNGPDGAGAAGGGQVRRSWRGAAAPVAASAAGPLGRGLRCAGDRSPRPGGRDRGAVRAGPLHRGTGSAGQRTADGLPLRRIRAHPSPPGQPAPGAGWPGGIGRVLHVAGGRRRQRDGRTSFDLEPHRDLGVDRGGMAHRARGRRTGGAPPARTRPGGGQRRRCPSPGGPDSPASRARGACGRGGRHRPPWTAATCHSSAPSTTFRLLSTAGATRECSSRSPMPAGTATLRRPCD